MGQRSAIRRSAGVLEREEELARIAEALARAATGEPSLVVIEGAAGIGKTALLGEAVLAARKSNELRVLTARPGELDSDFAYGVVRQLLDPVVAAASAQERAGLLIGAAAPAMAALGPPSEAPPVDVSFGVLEGLYWLVVELATTRPLALFVDDAQWADWPSLRFLGQLLRRIEGLSIAVVVAFREGDRSPRQTLIDDLRLDPLAERVAPRPLSERAVTSVLRAALPDAEEAFCRACHRASAGNPLYVRELLHAIVAEGIPPREEEIERMEDLSPASVARYVLRRVGRLGNGASELAAAMATLGDGAALVDAAAIVSLDDREGARLARALQEADVLAGEDPIRFAHPIVRRAIYSDLSLDRRDRLHVLAAERLAEVGSSSDLVAGQLLACRPGGRPESVRALRAAAGEARARGAPEVAVTYLRRALAEPPAVNERGDVLHELGTAEEMIGDQACVEHLAGARDAALEPEVRAGRAIELGNALQWLFRDRECIEVLEAALAEPGLTASQRELLEAYLLADSVPDAWANRHVAALHEQRAAHPPDDPLAARLVLAARAVRADQPAAEIAELALQAIGGGPLPPIGHFEAIVALIYADAFDDARRELEQVLPLARAAGVARGIAAIETQFATMNFASGDLPACETHARTAIRVFLSGAAQAAGPALPTAALVAALAYRGAFEEAEQALEQVGPQPWHQHFHFIGLLSARGLLRWLQGRDEECVADLAEARVRFSTWSSTAMLPISTLAGGHEPLALARLGREKEALALADAELERAQRWGSPRGVGIGLRNIALLEGNAGTAREAVDTLASGGGRVEHVHALLALGVLLRREGSRKDAREVLWECLELARRCGATVFADRAWEELRVAGAKPRRDRVTGRDALTPAEDRVARLAAGGRTNREVAQDLYLSLKTVEMHLGRVYRKLGIAGRRELAGALEESSEVPSAEPTDADVPR